MTTNLVKKYKDTTPEDTINNIKNFFENKGYKITVENLTEPFKNVWWCQVRIYQEDNLIMSANGKGTTKEYAMASGHGELYERYCCFNNSFITDYNMKQGLYALSKEKNNYFLFPDECMMSIEDSINSSPRFQDYFEKFKDNNNFVFDIFSDLYPDGFVGLPFINLNDSTTKIFPFDLLISETGSDGMAAGNTKEEALVQSFSEIVEHYIVDQIFFNSNKVKYYELNFNAIPEIADYLKEYKKELEKLNYQVKVFDFSYNFQVPVIGILVIDKNTHTSYINFGASPVLNIAIERCFTEIYQGFHKMGDSLKKIMIPYRNIKPYSLFETFYPSVTVCISYPEALILNTEIKDNYNTDIFLSSNEYSNKFLVNYYKNIFNNINFEVYYRFFSQSENIHCVYTYVNNVKILKGKPQGIYKKDSFLSFQLAKHFNLLLKEYLENNNFNKDLFIKVLNLFNTLTKNNSFEVNPSFMRGFYDKNSLYDILKFFGLLDMVYQNNYSIFERFSFNQSLNIDFITDDTYKYWFLYLYKEKYSIKEIQQIANIYGVEITFEDIANLNNTMYYIENIFFKPTKNFYESTKYKNLIYSYMPILI